MASLATTRLLSDLPTAVCVSVLFLHADASVAKSAEE